MFDNGTFRRQITAQYGNAAIRSQSFVIGTDNILTGQMQAVFLIGLIQ